MPSLAVIAGADSKVLRRSWFASRGRVGRTLPAICKLADRGLVWPLLGAALCLLWTTRRPGAGGVGAVLVSSAFTGVVQKVVDRDRPTLLTSLLSRGSMASPTSSSFPSTHAAKAFAFASAATWACPALGPAPVPSAAAISAARVGIAHHYPSKVMAGAVTGAGVGVFIGVLVRRGHFDASPRRLMARCRLAMALLSSPRLMARQGWI